MRAVAAHLLAIALIAAGCSGDTDLDASGSGRPPSPAASSSGTATRAPSSSAAPSEAAVRRTVPRPPPARNDRRGRTRFARYVLLAWVHALNTNDPGALLDVSGARPCAGCRELQAELETRAREGWYVDLDAVHVTSARVREAGRTSRVLLSVSLPESDTFYDDGSFRSTNPAHPRSTFEVEMTYAGSRFRLDSFSLY